MTDQSGTFDDVADDIIHKTNKGLGYVGKVAHKGTKSEIREAATVGGTATAGAFFFGPAGALLGGFIGYLIFEGLKD